MLETIIRSTYKHYYGNVILFVFPVRGCKLALKEKSLVFQGQVCVCRGEGSTQKFPPFALICWILRRVMLQGHDP